MTFPSLAHTISPSTEKGHGRGVAYLCVALLTAMKIYVLWAHPFSLFFDEAQYWIWSLHPDWGYYSKPPMVAWLITLTTSVCGEEESCIRLGAPFLHLLTSMLIYEIGCVLYSSRVGFYSALTYITVPAVFVSSFLISTDPPLLFFWALALFAFIKALQGNEWRWWFLAGMAAGAGMLSKYTMLLFLFSSFGYLLTSPTHKLVLKHPRYWVAALLAFLIFLPNILWNATHGFVSFLHTKDNANLEGSLFHPLHMLEFIGEQAGVFGPILFISLVIVLCRIRAMITRESYALLYWFTLPLLGLIILVSMLSRAHANWAAPAYLAATVLVTAFLLEKGRVRWLQASIVLHMVLFVIAANFSMLTSWVGLTISNVRSDIKHGVIYDPFIQVKGWDHLALEVGDVLLEYPNARLLIDSRKLYGELVYYIDPHPFDSLKWNPNGVIEDHFDLTASLTHAPSDASFIFVSRNKADRELARYFSSVEHIKTIIIPTQHPDNSHYEIYHVKGFNEVFK